MRQRTANSPIHVSQTIEAMGVVREETTFVSQDGCLEDDDCRRRCFIFRCFGDLGEERFFEIALFADDGTNEGVVVLEKRVSL